MGPQSRAPVRHRWAAVSGTRAGRGFASRGRHVLTCSPSVGAPRKILRQVQPDCPDPGSRTREQRAVGVSNRTNREGCACNRVAHWNTDGIQISKLEPEVNRLIPDTPSTNKSPQISAHLQPICPVPCHHEDGGKLASPPPKRCPGCFPAVLKLHRSRYLASFADCVLGDFPVTGDGTTGTDDDMPAGSACFSTLPPDHGVWPAPFVSSLAAGSRPRGLNDRLFYYDGVYASLTAMATSRSKAMATARQGR